MEVRAKDILRQRRGVHILDRHRLNLQCRKVSPSLRPSLPSPFPGTYQLTKVWTTTYLPPHLKRRLISVATSTTPLSTIEHLALIDLLRVGGVGSPRPHVRSYFPDTAWLFDVLVSAEKRLCDTPRLRRARQRFLLHARRRGYQLGIHGRRPSTVFMSRCERVAHHRCIIAEPFPCVWHTRSVLSSQRASSDPSPPAKCPNLSGFVLATSMLAVLSVGASRSVVPSLNGQSGLHAAGSPCIGKVRSVTPGQGHLQLRFERARAICHVMSQRGVVRTRAQLGDLLAAPCVCPRPGPLLYRLVTPCRPRACILVGSTPTLAVALCGPVQQ